MKRGSREVKQQVYSKTIHAAPVDQYVPSELTKEGSVGQANMRFVELIKKRRIRHLMDWGLTIHNIVTWAYDICLLITSVRCVIGSDIVLGHPPPIDNALIIGFRS